MNWKKNHGGEHEWEKGMKTIGQNKDEKRKNYIETVWNNERGCINNKNNNDKRKWLEIERNIYCYRRENKKEASLL